MSQKLESVIIFIAHIALLAWMFYALSEGGTLTTGILMLHFTGMAIYGALLIRISAYLAHRRFVLEQKENQKS